MSNTSCDHVPQPNSQEGASKLKKKRSRRHSAHVDGSKEVRKEASQEGKLKKKSSRRNSKAHIRRSKSALSAYDADPLSTSLSSSANVLERFKTMTLDEQIALKRAAKERKSTLEDDDSSLSSADSGCDEDAKDCEALKPPDQIWAQSSETSSNNEVVESDLGGKIASKMASKESSIDRNLSKGNDKTAELKVPSLGSAQQFSKSSMVSMSAGFTEKAALDSYEERLRRKLAEGSSGSSGRSIYRPAPKTWSCSKCTYVNKISFSACEMCKEPKEMPTKKISTYAPSSSPGVSFVPGPNSRNNVWQCSSCTYQNTGTRRSCEVCGVSR